MTPRGYCLLIPALLGAGAGLLRNYPALTLLSLSVVLWIMVEWLWFQWRLLSEVRSLQIERTINGRTNTTGVCFAGRRVWMRVTVRRRRGQIRPWTRIRDLVPGMLSVVDGSPVHLAADPQREITIAYSCQSQSAGIATLPGCRVRIQDPNGFFISDRFVSVAPARRILPDYDSSVEPHPQVKRLNGLPQHGIHRLQRAGMGSELLELREYVPGDPPKSIAWKVSARRDRLMTREYESEVPVRTIVFADTSPRTRRGPWGSRPCDAASHLTASIAKTAISAGDPAGLVLFSDTGIRWLSPGWGERTLFRILDMLAESCRTDESAVTWTSALQNEAMEICQDRYPELLDVRLNTIPWTVFPITPWNRRIFNKRCLLAGVLSQIHHLNAAEWGRLLYDNAFMGRHISRLLHSTGQSTGRFRSSSADKRDSGIRTETLQQLSRAVSQAVSQARDNEHYVIVCDLLDGEFLLPEIRPALQLARARHHRLSVVCPLPAAQAISGNANDPPTEPLLLHEAWQIQLQERRDRLKRELRSLGASLTFADRDRPTALTLSELGLTRRGRAPAGVS